MLACMLLLASAASAFERNYQKFDDVPVFKGKENGLRVVFIPLELTDLPLAGEVRDQYEHITGIEANVRRLKYDWEWNKPDRGGQYDAIKFNKHFRNLIQKRFRGDEHTVFVAITGKDLYTGKNPYIFSHRLSDEPVKVAVITYAHLYNEAAQNWQQLMIDRTTKEALVVTLNAIGVKKAGQKNDPLDFAASLQEIDAKPLTLPLAEQQQIDALKR